MIIMMIMLMMGELGESKCAQLQPINRDWCNQSDDPGDLGADDDVKMLMTYFVNSFVVVAIYLLFLEINFGLKIMSANLLIVIMQLYFLIIIILMIVFGG